MAFKPKIISDEVTDNITSNIQLGIDNDITKAASKTKTTTQTETTSAKGAPAPQKPREFDADSVIKNSDVDYQKWLSFKKIVLMKPIEQLEDKVLNIQLPSSIVQRLGELGWWNKSIHNKTIVCNLIVDFLAQYKDIIDLLEKNKK